MDGRISYGPVVSPADSPTIHSHRGQRLKTGHGRDLRNTDYWTVVHFFLVCVRHAPLGTGQNERREVRWVESSFFFDESRKLACGALRYTPMLDHSATPMLDHSAKGRRC